MQNALSYHLTIECYTEDVADHIVDQHHKANRFLAYSYELFWNIGFGECAYGFTNSLEEKIKLQIILSIKAE